MYARTMSSGFIHKKSLGQHFLTSEYVPQQMCLAADLQPHDIVLEIGPGTGALTKTLLAHGATVIAVEADLRAISALTSTFEDAIKEGRLILHHADARTLDFKALQLEPYRYKVIANIPYYLSGLLLRQLLDTEYQPHSIVFLIQKELAERIARDPKASLLSLSVKLFGTPRYITTVKRGHFNPPPKVDSAIIAISNISRDTFTTFSSPAAFSILHDAFRSKRKQLVGNLQTRFGREVVSSALTSLGFPVTIRAEDIPVEAWRPLITQLLSTENPQ